ncbi:10479_t:CDS:1 [Funneliformis geosporum]|uniref:10479_t:CDS:1 n=1 Tax=Funneliformis geosporum TaxID=1117311 RepID=A0A9W4SVC2_9GLOM|nr:10479_t:CDS:1 [Funneliformis geosporum]
MIKYIRQRYLNYQSNQNLVINSALDRKRKIILDHILITLPDSSTRLLIEPDTVKSAAINHFQNLAVLNNYYESKVIPEEWQHQYASKENINHFIFDTLMNSLSKDEWTNILHNLPNGKASDHLEF